MPPAETLIGRLKKEMYGVSTDEAKFHLHLGQPRKDRQVCTGTEALVMGRRKVVKKLPKMSNPIFLFDLKQISDKNETRAAIYRSDLKKFLGLKNDLGRIDTSHSSRNLHFAINICDKKYLEVRAALMKNAVEASTWIRKYFLKSQDVMVSSPEFFNELLEEWMVDPCVHR